MTGMNRAGRRIAPLACLLLLVAETTRSQTIDWAETGSSPQQVCLTARLLESDEGRDALAAFEAAGKTSSRDRTTRPSFGVGDVARFNVRTNVSQPPYVWKAYDFVLKVQHLFVPPLEQLNGFRIWVESSQLDARAVSDEQLESLRSALAESTPPLSVDPGQGILVNDARFFGAPPYYDQDGLIDILLVDIIEGGAGTIVNGFFDPNDLNPQLAGTSRSNQGEFLYLDTQPTLSGGIGRLLETVAHEFQHLIHARWDANEITFVNEGLSEWAQGLNGYRIRDVHYLARGPDGYNVPLFGWDSSDPLPGYERAGLWTLYLAEQFGPEMAGSVTREPANGADGYGDALVRGSAGTDLEDAISNFHTANVVNDTGADTRFGYASPLRTPFAVEPGLYLQGADTTESEPILFNVQPGAVEYVEWRSVENLHVRLEVLATDRSRLTARLVLEPFTGPISWRDLDLRETEHLANGAFERVRLVLAHNAVSSQAASALFISRWAKTEVATVAVRYDNGEWGGKALSTGSTTGSGYATLFERPSSGERVRLRRASLPNYYIDQFQPATTGARNFRFSVWDESIEDRPGTELFGMRVEDRRGLGTVSLNDPLGFYELDLPVDNEALGDLPDRFFIGATNTGADENYLVLLSSSYPQENRSFFKGASGWTPLWDVPVSGWSLEGRLVPVRAEFVIDGRIVAAERDHPAVVETALLPQFPNPAWSSVDIPYALGQSGDVVLEVYDAIGRHYQTLVDARVEAGNQLIRADVGRWPAGVYCLVLTTSTHRRTRLLTVVH